MINFGQNTFKPSNAGTTSLHPVALTVQLESIPVSLQAIPRWVLWKYEARNDHGGDLRWTKVPKTGLGRNASTNKPETWASFEQIAQAYRGGNYDGIGLVLSDSLHGIDLDDCRDVETGKLNELASEVLSRVHGYAEISPSGTGIKIFTSTNLDAAMAKHDDGVELYPTGGRYFAITGHRLAGHDELPDTVQDLSWLVSKLFKDEVAIEVSSSNRSVSDLSLYKAPQIGWDTERVKAEILAHLDPDCGYHDWIKVGMALCHQGQSDYDWLQLWDEWSQGAPEAYVVGECEKKWATFSVQRKTGNGPVTLSTLVLLAQQKLAKEKRLLSAEWAEKFEQQIANTNCVHELRDQVAGSIAKNAALLDMDREILAVSIKDRAKNLGLKLGINDVRSWLSPRASWSSGFIHVNDQGHPLCTIDNLRCLLADLGYVVRYNVIKKGIEILVPGVGFTRDNRDNAAIARVLSECEKARMPTKHAMQYLIALADENLYNPVATWIKSTPWDGESRLEAFFATVKVNGNEELKKKLLRKWLLQAVAAAFSFDGIAAQGILTFVGRQNIGKTTWFQRLAPPELDAILTGHTLDTKSKDSVFVALSFWLVELGEVDATFKKSDISALKSFVTQPLDKIRRPYAATESNYGRRTVFGATVNESTFLHDPTGNRRFWTIEVEAFESNSEIDMQQLWAEVWFLWNAGEEFNLDQVEVQQLSKHNENFTANDPMEEMLRAKWPEVAPKSWEWVTATEAVQRIGISVPTRQHTITASRVLQKLNGGQRRVSNGRVLFAMPSLVPGGDNI